MNMKQVISILLIAFFIVSTTSCKDKSPKVVFNAVDLGLPSGCLWAEMNLGATSIEDHGCFYFWGDPEPCKYGSRYKYVNDCYYDGGGEPQVLKYVINPQYGKVDNKRVLDNDDDAAFIATGGKWTIPTESDIDELISCCKWEEVEMNGKPGIKFIGPNGNSIFLPNPGEYNTVTYKLYEGSGSGYWTNSACHSTRHYSWDFDGTVSVNWVPEESLTREDYAFALLFSVTYRGLEVEKNFDYRTSSAMIRPVCHK